MNIKRLLAIISLFLLAACGGGGDGGSPATPTVISGVASKGIIVGGTVKVYALNVDGSMGKLLGSAVTDANGAYSIDIGVYTGPVTLEVSGTYTDEATGLPKTVPEYAPLRAALSSASGNVTLPVTPLTDLAVRQAGTLTANNITAANTLISNAFKVDIIATTPVAPTSAAFSSSTTTQAQRDYTMALAAISQQMASGDTLEAVLNTLDIGIGSTGMTSGTATTITTALTSFIANSNNQTGVSSIAETSLQNIGLTSMKLTVALNGSDVASVKGIQTIITLPAGVLLRSDATGKLLTGVITTMGSASSGYPEGKFTSAANTLTLGLITAGNLTAGDIITINLDLASGTTTAPAASAFTIGTSNLVDNNGLVVSGASLSLR